MRIAHIAAHSALALCCFGLASCSLLVTGDEFIGDEPPNCPAATALPSPITATTTLRDVVSDPLCPDYVADGRVAVMASLTLSPGVVIEFAPRTGIDVAASGALIARGTSAAPIVLRGGDWDGVAVRSDDVLNELDYVTVEGASGDLYGAAVFVDRGAALAVRHSVIRGSGAVGLWLQNADAEFIFNDSARLLGFAENRFESNAAAPLRLSFSQVPMLDAATVYDPTEAANGAREIEVRWGGLRENATGPALNVPYHFVGDGADRLFFTGNAAEVTSPRASMWLSTRC